MTSRLEQQHLKVVNLQPAAWCGWVKEFYVQLANMVEQVQL